MVQTGLLNLCTDFYKAYLRQYFSSQYVVRIFCNQKQISNWLILSFLLSKPHTHLFIPLTITNPVYSLNDEGSKWYPGSDLIRLRAFLD